MVAEGAWIGQPGRAVLDYLARARTTRLCHPMGKRNAASGTGWVEISLSKDVGDQTVEVRAGGVMQAGIVASGLLNSFPSAER